MSNSVVRKSNSSKETKLVLVGMVVGLILGLLIFYLKKQEWIVYIHPLTEIFMRSLKLIIVPLVLTSIFGSIVGLESPEHLKVLGKKSIIYYFLTTALAVIIGIVCVNIIKPGVGVPRGLVPLPQDISGQLTEHKGLFSALTTVVVQMVPKNPFEALVKSDILQVIFITIVLALICMHRKAKTKILISLMEEVHGITFRVTEIILKFAPIGVMALMAELISQTGVSVLADLFKYAATVLIGLFIHGVILLLMASIVTKENPISILKKLFLPLGLAFASASSASAIPVSISTLEKNFKVRKEITSFVLPLGATVNMNGTALYESVAVLFIAQSLGMDMDASQQIIIFVTSTIAAVGAAAIPGAGLVTMGIVLNAVGLPLEGIGLILSIDRILDMFRTSINVMGDCIGALVINARYSAQNKDEKISEGIK